MTQAEVCFKYKFGFCKFNKRSKHRHVTLVCVKITNVMFLNVRKDTKKFAGFIEITRGVNLQ